MIQVTCEKCGSQQSLDDAQVPPSGKVMKCPTCTHPIIVMPPKAPTASPSAGPGKPPLVPGKSAPRPTLSGQAPVIPPPPGYVKEGGRLPGGPALAAFDAGIGEPTGTSALADLPPPIRKSPLHGADSGPQALVDLPVPVGPTPTKGVTDLPAPVGPRGTKQSVTDLPAPVGPKPTRQGITDLPTPVGPKPTKGIVDLPTPVGPIGTKNLPDLPTPVGPTGTKQLPDLPTPVGPIGTKNLPDLLTPVGPTSTKQGAIDLPAPKGFFDDGLQPAGTRGKLDLPAPKGFFDDGVKPASAGGKLDLPAPKGFFDSAPPPRTARAAAVPAPPMDDALELDDFDLSPLEGGPAPAPVEFPALDLEPPLGPRGSTGKLFLADVDGAARAPAPAVPLELNDGERFDGLDLPGQEPGVVTFSGAERAAPERAPLPAPPPTPPGAGIRASFEDQVLELDEQPRRDAPVARVAPGTAPGAAIDERPAKVRVKALPSPEALRRRRLAGVAVLVVLALGAGGYYAYQRWEDAKQRAAGLDRMLLLSRKQLGSSEPGHWESAANVAERVLRADSGRAEALGVAAQAYFAAAVDEGTNAKGRIAQGKKKFEEIGKRAVQGPDVDKATALRAIVEHHPDQAIEVLREVIKKDVSDGDAYLYLGWAHAANHDPEAAGKAFRSALKQNPNRLAALYGLGQVQLARGEVKEARKSFLAVIERNKSHIGAQVGNAQIVEVERVGDRENRYLEILERKDLDSADPRAVSLAWALAGDEALRSGRIEEARARYGKAAELDPDNLAALIGEGKTALAQGKLDVARDRLSAALAVDASNLDALLTFAEASARAGELAKAKQTIEHALKLAPQDPRVHLAEGVVLETDPQGGAQAAEKAYRKAIELSGGKDIDPAVALARLLIAQGRSDDAKTVLQPIEGDAQDDPKLAVTLGVAYLGTGDAPRAERWFRRALQVREGDIEALFQLGVALHQQKREEEAITTLKHAFDTDPTRDDIGVMLAMVYEQIGHDGDAGAMYRKLLEDPTPSINVRVQAGRYYARIGETAKAAALGELILAENARHAAGLFLRGEGLYLDKKYGEAQRDYRQSVIIDPQPQFLEGLGRASEQLQQYDDALRAYGRAIAGDPRYLPPRVGRIRIRLARREYQLALDEINQALALAPQDAELYAWLGECYYRLGNEAKAVTALTTAIKLATKQPTVYFTLGMAYYDLDRPRDAASAFERATAPANGDEVWFNDALFFYGMSLRSAGRYADGARVFGHLLQRTPKTDARYNDVLKLKLRMETGRP